MDLAFVPFSKSFPTVFTERERQFVPAVMPGIVYRDKFVQKYCLQTISNIYEILCSPQFVTKVMNMMYKYDRDIFSKVVDMRYMFTFYLKGGNAVPLLRSQIYPSTFPFPCEGDFDTSVLINPKIDPQVWTGLREIIIVEIVHSLYSMMMKILDWPLLSISFMQHGLQETNQGESTIRVLESAWIPEDANLHKYVYSPFQSRERQMFPPGCPLTCTIIPNVSHMSKVLNFTLIRLSTQTEPPVTLIDISIPNSKYENLAFEWQILKTNLFHTYMPRFRFPIADGLTTYIDFRVAAKTDDRKNKVQSRTRRANQVRNTVIKPLLQSGSLRQAEIDALKSITHPNSRVGSLKAILNDVNETNTPAN